MSQQQAQSKAHTSTPPPPALASTSRPSPSPFQPPSTSSYPTHLQHQPYMHHHLPPLPSLPSSAAASTSNGTAMMTLEEAMASQASGLGSGLGRGRTSLVPIPFSGAGAGAGELPPLPSLKPPFHLREEVGVGSSVDVSRETSVSVSVEGEGEGEGESDLGTPGGGTTGKAKGKGKGKGKATATTKSRGRKTKAEAGMGTPKGDDGHQDGEAEVVEGGEAGQAEVDWSRTRKDNHKEVERRRRETINTGINELKALVPGCDKNKGSILKQAVAYIVELKASEQRNIEKWTLERLLSGREREGLERRVEEGEREVRVLRERVGELEGMGMGMGERKRKSEEEEERERDGQMEETKRVRRA